MVKRIIHRHKIDEDQFVTKSGELFNSALPFLEKYKTQILRGLTGVAIGLLVLFLIVSFSRKSSERSQAELDDALALAMAGTGAAEGDAEAAGKLAQAKEKLQSFTQTHSGETAAWAHFHLGRLLMAEGQTEPAIEHYRAFLAQGPGAGAPLGRMALGYALLKAGKSAEAVTEWEALKASGWNADQMDLEIATAQLATDRAKALETLKTLSTKADSPAAAQAKERLRLQAPEIDASLILKSLADPPAAEGAATGATDATATPVEPGAAAVPAEPAAASGLRTDLQPTAIPVAPAEPAATPVTEVQPTAIPAAPAEPAATPAAPVEGAAAAPSPGPSALAGIPEP